VLTGCEAVGALWTLGNEATTLARVVGLRVLNRQMGDIEAARIRAKM